MATLRNTRVALIACSKLKSRHVKPVVAPIRYWPSPLFRLSYEYAKNYWKATEIYILSAKYDLIPESELIEDYDQTLSKMSRVERLHWANKVNIKLEEMGRHGGRSFLVLAGQLYYKDLNLERLALHGNRVELPLKGLPLGVRLSWLGRTMDDIDKAQSDDP